MSNVLHSQIAFYDVNMEALICEESLVIQVNIIAM